MDNSRDRIIIRQGSIKDCLEVSSRIPEFSDHQYNEAVYHERLDNKPHLILVAFRGGIPVGFKAGYERDADGSFYSWMGGIVPEFRQLKIARQLAEEQELWAKKQGYSSIIFKTRNYLKSMLIFALKNGFHIIDILKKEQEENHRIILKKIL
ncbi:GNAT family N-acetyltransferase [Emticicia sp. CRIBPO]|uniref:GNAT family N-acetyltransferase n=1 Tax=Emticicia sp. CRIBPO TaxID=2683258 RepID=UPI0014124EF0|nr:GNAT family N-acetyltransferase [Emticicia sp. CRIBPO]NBA88850.1 GNAT family N-acetyltransferase [Emticicia sp. CRIBPO]